MFIRALRRAGLRPSYSHGFNPHPKVGMALPLSLGQYSECELAEFETEASVDLAQAKERLNAALPTGISVKEVLEKPAEMKGSLASLVRSAKYEIRCAGLAGGGHESRDGEELSPEGKLAGFMAQDSIVIEKLGKKARKSKTGARPESIDIRDRIGSYTVKRAFDNEMLFEVQLSAEPGRSLSPKDFCKALQTYAGWSTEETEFTITRTAIQGQNGHPLV
jgi:radical SAM-linked protein